MSWLSVLAIILQLLGPVLVRWLEELLDDAAREMTYGPSPDSGGFDHDLAKLFERARGELWWFQFSKRTALRLVERVVIRRRDQILQGAVMPLDADEVVALRAALA